MMLLTSVHCRQDVAQRPTLRESKPKQGQPQKWLFHQPDKENLSSFQLPRPDFIAENNVSAAVILTELLHTEEDEMR